MLGMEDKFMKKIWKSKEVLVIVTRGDEMKFNKIKNDDKKIML